MVLLPESKLTQHLEVHWTTALDRRTRRKIVEGAWDRRQRVGYPGPNLVAWHTSKWQRPASPRKRHPSEWDPWPNSPFALGADQWSLGDFPPLLHRDGVLVESNLDSWHSTQGSWNLRRTAGHDDRKTGLGQSRSVPSLASVVAGDSSEAMHIVGKSPTSFSEATTTPSAFHASHNGAWPRRLSTPGSRSSDGYFASRFGSRGAEGRRSPGRPGSTDFMTRPVTPTISSTSYQAIHRAAVAGLTSGNCPDVGDLAAADGTRAPEWDANSPFQVKEVEIKPQRFVPGEWQCGGATGERWRQGNEEEAALLQRRQEDLLLSLARAGPKPW